MRINQLTSFSLLLMLQLTYGTYGWNHFLTYRNLNPVAFPQGQNNRVQVLPLSDRADVPPLQVASTQISRGSEIFSLEMFRVIAEAVKHHDFNFIISPFSVWSLMVLLAEGATDNSFLQLEKTLRLPEDLTYLRQAYRQFQRALVVNTSTVELAVNQALFSDTNRPVDYAYGKILDSDYEADHIPVDFRNAALAVKTINDHISHRTRGKIQEVLKKEDLSEAQLLLTSAIYFKGQWKFPFNETFTTNQPFFRENGDFVGHVKMMAQRNTFPFAMINELDASVLELPYGKEDRVCMLLLLPRRNSSVTRVIQKLSNYTIAQINNELHKYDNTEDFEEAEIELTMPRFSIDSDLELRTVFEAMGITDIFDPAQARLSKISRQSVYVSRVFHKAVIEVNEVGTVASAFTGATVSFKQTPIEFVANRPFVYLITDRKTNTLLFAGQVVNPLA